MCYVRLVRLKNSIMGSNTYIIDCGGSYLDMVDCGDFDKIYSYISEHKKKEIRNVFITHTHYDHIYGLPFLIKEFPNCKIYTSINGKDALASPSVNLSKYFNDLIEINFSNIIVLKDGDIIETDLNYSVQIVYTPGHDFSSICYIMNGYIFTGDSYIPGVETINSMPKSDKVKAKKSEFKIKRLIKTKKLIICPGHGEVLVNNKM